MNNKHTLFLIIITATVLLIVHGELYGEIWKLTTHLLFIAVLALIGVLAYIAGYIVGTSTTVISEKDGVKLEHKGNKTIIKE